MFRQNLGRYDQGERGMMSVGLLHRSGTTLHYAVRSINRELFGFQSDYPLEAIQAAGPVDSLHYYVYSDRLFLDDVEFDRNGIAMKHYRAQGLQYNPLFIAWWGLINLERYLKTTDSECLRKFFLQVEWLRLNAVTREDGAVVWPCYFDWQEGLCKFQSPWISAMIQGVVISALVRAYRVGGDKGLLVLCEQAARVFEKRIEDGGVRTVEQGRVLYEEYPGFPLARVLDGFLVSLLGLFDLWAETQNATIQRLFDDGVQGLLHTIELWNYKDKWSWYGSHGYLCPSHYHQLNRLLLIALANVTGESRLSHYAELWNPVRLNTLERIWLYLVFVTLKNWSRLKSIACR